MKTAIVHCIMFLVSAVWWSMLAVGFVILYPVVKGLRLEQRYNTSI